MEKFRKSRVFRDSLKVYFAERKGGGHDFVEFMKRESEGLARRRKKKEGEKKKKKRDSAHVELYEKKIYSHAVGPQLKRFTNRNSWLSINRCHSLTSLPARPLLATY